MLISRRDAISGAAAAMMAMRANPALASLLSDNADAMHSLLQRRWSGTATTNAPGITGGKFSIYLNYSFKPYSDLTFDGECSIHSALDGESYYGLYSIAGYCWGENGALGIEFSRHSFISGSTLPSGMYWQGFNGRLTVYKHPSSADNFILHGTLYGMQDGAAFDTTVTDA